MSEKQIQTGQPALSLEQSRVIVESKAFPRVTKEGIEKRILSIEYAWPFSNEQLTLCCITMSNGFSVLGKSAPASPGNFDEEVGKRYAYEDAFKQLWGLEAYLLKEKLVYGEYRI